MKVNNLFTSLSITACLISVLLAPTSCRKIKDTEFKPNESGIVQKFFNLPETASDGLKRVVADIRKQEDKNHFVGQLVAKYGLPVWNKSITETSISNMNARSATDDSLQLFLIPFRAADSSVSSYLFCARNGNDFTYRYYKMNTLEHLYAANDTIKQLREGLLGIFGFFEKRINNKDSIPIGGIYNESIKDVIIKVNSNPVSYTSRSTVMDLSILEVCYTVGDGGGPQARSTSHTDVRCIQVGVYGSLFDMGFTTENGYTSTGGGGGGGGTGGFPDGFQCPQTEWWCESGDYTFINGVLYTPESYPGIDIGFPWLWWENSAWIANYPYSYLDFSIDAPDDPVIENGIELSNVPSINPGNQSRVIGYSPDRGNIEDMQFGSSGDPTGIYQHLLSKPDDELFSIMGPLFNWCTVFDGDLENVGDLMIERFRNSVGGSYENSILNEKVKNSSAFKNYLKNFGEKLREKLIQAGGNISNVLTINMENSRPVFNGLYNKFHGLQILINDTEYTEIKLDNFEVSSDGKWNADVTVTIHDHFGLDKNDALEYQEWHQGFPSWWILQHMRSYRPFETVVNVKMRITITP